MYANTIESFLKIFASTRFGNLLTTGSTIMSGDSPFCMAVKPLVIVCLQVICIIPLVMVGDSSYWHLEKIIFKLSRWKVLAKKHTEVVLISRKLDFIKPIPIEKGNYEYILSDYERDDKYMNLLIFLNVWRTIIPFINITLFKTILMEMSLP